MGMTPYKSPHDLLEVKGLPCRPCSKIGSETCPQGHFKCMQLLQTETDLASPHLRDRMRHETVFGALLLECAKDAGFSNNGVAYGRHLEADVLDQVVGGEHQLEFSRLLRSVTATEASTIQGASLVVATY